MQNPPAKTPAVNGPAPVPQKRFTGASADPAIEGQLETLLQSLYGLHHTEIDLSLDRTYRFLERLGNPHLRLPPVVHIAGTNGKGSTTATLRALFEASGHTVHTYTSPHLVHPTERIVLAGVPIASGALIALLTECIEMNKSDPITFFELFTCAAFLAFSRVSADVLLLETGMGGRLDTTNVVPDPVVTIITTVSRDHTAFLGKTIPAIAGEKAGIMKGGVPCIIGHQLAEAMEDGIMDVFLKQSQSLSPPAPLMRYGAEWASAPESDRMMFRYGDDSICLPRPVLAGIHQVWNAGAALAAFRTIAPDHFLPEILSTAMANIEWPGRLQILKNHPFNAVAPWGWEIVIDGGHNDSAGLILADRMGEWRRAESMPLHLIVAMVDRKDPAAFLAPLLPFTASITATRIENEPSSYTPDLLANVARTLGFQNIGVADTPLDAVNRIVRMGNVQPPSRILITGSLFLMGDILRLQPY